VKAERGRGDANDGESAGLNRFARLDTAMHTKYQCPPKKLKASRTEDTLRMLRR
jgi:hypothetical protein